MQRILGPGKELKVYRYTADDVLGDFKHRIVSRLQLPGAVADPKALVTDLVHRLSLDKIQGIAIIGVPDEWVH